MRGRGGGGDGSVVWGEEARVNLLDEKKSVMKFFLSGQLKFKKNVN